MVSGPGRHPLAGGGLGEADGVAGGEHDVGVVQEAVDGGVGDGLGHELVEACGVQVGGQGDGALLVGGVDDPVEPFGGVGGDGQEPNVVDDDDIGSQDALDGSAGGVIGAVAADEGAEVLEAESADVGAMVDGCAAERVEEVGLAGA